MKHPTDKGWQQAVAASAVLGVMFSAVVFNVMTTRAFSFDANFQQTGIGEDGPYVRQCQVMFDSYLLNLNNWENRISNFAQDIFSQVIANLQQYVICNLGFIDISAGFASNASIFKRPNCDIPIVPTSGDLKDMAERDLYYDNVVRCESRAMLNAATEAASRVAQENGIEGGTTFVQDYIALQTSAESRGRAKAINTFRHTRYCPWMQPWMQAAFNFDPADAVALTENTESNIEPYTQRAECSFPPGVTSTAVAQMPDGLYLLSLPQNNLLGTYLMAQEEISRQIELEVTGATTRAIAGQGDLGTSGETAEESCVTRDEQGTCLQEAPIVRTGTQITNSIENAEEAEYGWLLTSQKMGQLMGDSVNRMVQRMFDLTRRDIRFDFTPDHAQNLYSGSAAQSTAPAPFTDPDDSTGAANYCGLPSDTQCTCLANPSDPGYEAAQQVRGILLPAMGAARLQNPQLFGADGKILPGKNAEFVNQVCLQLGLSQQGCRPYIPRADDVIIIPGPNSEVAIDIIRADGGVRVAPTVKYSCALGVFP